MYPIKGESYITQKFGLTDFARSETGKWLYRNFPGGIHPGIDFGTHGKRLPAIALVKGKVIFAGWAGGNGNYVEILGEDGWIRQYMHLDAIAVVKGEEVGRGDEVGTVGTTGYVLSKTTGKKILTSTGIHLHYGKYRKSFGRKDYADPTSDFLGVVIDPPPMPTKKLIKSDIPLDRAVYVYNGKTKFPIPDWETKVFLFGEGSDDIELVESSIISKIPDGAMVPSLR